MENVADSKLHCAMFRVVTDEYKEFPFATVVMVPSVNRAFSDREDSWNKKLTANLLHMPLLLRYIVTG